VSVNLVFNKARSKESTALKAALGFRNDEPNAQFSITKGGGDKEFSWLLPVTTNFHNMPSTRELWRQDSAGTRQQENDDGTMKIKEMVLSPRFTWKSGSDTLTVAPSLFRAFGTRRNESTRIDLTVPAAGRSRYDDEDNRTAFNRLRADGEMTRQGIKYSTRFAGSDGERRADVTRTAVDSLGATSISQENTRREERDVNAAFRIDWAVGEQDYVTERRTVLDA
jgi:iron complex outermembrane receptor protein